MKNYNPLMIAGILLVMCIFVWIQVAILNSNLPDIWKWYLLR